MSPRVHPGVHRALRRQGTVDVIVTFEATTLESVREATFATRSAKINALREKLQAHHEFSARGPSAFAGRTKPDVTAPGFDIVSAIAASDTSYAAASGSSMATPHVAGTIALMLSAHPSLTADELKRMLYRTA
ncbi:hypothetical protein PybrP1_006870, partial [[Pythium] brassicae (nom. inval.)]